MNHLPFTLLAYFFNALAVLTSKFLLAKTIPEPLVYVFYISAFSLPALLAIPFTNVPEILVFFMASVSTLFWTLGAYLMYKALKIGPASRVIPIIGTTIPVILLIFASGSNLLSINQIGAILLLILGMVFLTFNGWDGEFSKKELLLELMSACLFAVSYMILRQAYLQLDFFSVIVWSRLILLPLCIGAFFHPLIKKSVLGTKKVRLNFISKAGMVFLGGQLAGVLSELLLLYSISIANPALVNSLQGTQYIFLFIFAAVMSRKFPETFKENYQGKVLNFKLIGIALMGLGVYFLSRV